MENYNVNCAYCATPHDRDEECGCEGEQLANYEKLMNKLATLFHIPLGECDGDVDQEQLFLAAKVAAQVYDSLAKNRERALQLTGHDSVIDALIALHVLQRKWEAVSNLLGLLPGCSGSNDHHSSLIRNAKEIAFGDDKWIYEENRKREEW